MRGLPFRCLLTLSLPLLLTPGCRPRPQDTGTVVYRHHFAGLNGVAERADLNTIQAILGLPASRQLVDSISLKLGSGLPAWLGPTSSNANDQATNLQPLARVLLQSESYLQVRARDRQVSSWGLAARIGEAEAGRFLRELDRILATRSPGGTNPRADHLAATNGWLLLGRGEGAFEELRATIARQGMPTAPSNHHLLSVDADLATIVSLAGWRSEPPGPIAQWPKVQLTVEPRNGRLRTTGHLAFSRPLGLALVPWQVPRTVLHDPLIGFTAVQGADTWLRRLALFADLKVSEWPRQMFFWSLAADPWLQYFAGTAESPTNFIAHVAPALPPRLMANTTWQGQSFGLRITNNASRVELRGLPFFAPFLEAIREGNQPMIFGGLFLPTKSGQPAPEELLQQVAGRTNLVLYDWELTGGTMIQTNPPGTAGPRVITNHIGRLRQFKELAQFGQILSRPPAQLPNTPTGEVLIPGEAWINAALPLLGESITELTLTGPDRLQLVRHSQVGLGSLELIHLLRWLENPAFPGWTNAPPPPRRQPRRDAATPRRP